MVAELRQPVTVFVGDSTSPALFFLSRCPIVGEFVTYTNIHHETNRYRVVSVTWNLDHEMPDIRVDPMEET